MQKVRKYVAILWLVIGCQIGFAVAPIPPITDLLVRHAKQECNGTELAEYILGAGYTYTDMIALLFGLQVIGYRKSYIHQKSMHVGILLKAWERQGLPLRDYMVMNYPDSLLVREKPGGELQPLGIYQFLNRLRSDWEQSQGLMHQLWLEPRVKMGRTLSGAKKFMQQFLIDVAFHAEWFDDIDMPLTAKPKALSFNPGAESSITTDIGLITLAFGGDTDTALKAFSDSYTKFWYPLSGKRMPRSDYLLDRKTGRQRVADELQAKLGELELPFTISVKTSQPLLQFRQRDHHRESNVATVFQRVQDGLKHADLPMSVFARESTDTNGGDSQFDVHTEALTRYGKFDDEFFSRVNDALGSQVFRKAPTLTWKQELMIQTAVYYLREAKYVDRFLLFQIWDEDKEHSPEYPLVPPGTFMQLWGELNPNQLVRFNQMVHRRLKGLDI